MGTDKKYAEGLMVLAARLAQLELDLGSASRFLSELISEENDEGHDPVRPGRGSENPGGEPGDSAPDDPERPTALRAEATGSERAVPAAPVDCAEAGQEDGRLSHWDRQKLYSQLEPCEFDDEAVPTSCMECGDTGFIEEANRACTCELGTWNNITELWDDARQGR